MALLDDIENLGSQVGASVLRGDTGAVTFESAINAGFPFTLKPLASSEPGGISDIIGKILKPKFTVTTPLGPVTVAPYGEPPTAPWVGILGLLTLSAVLGLGVYGAVKLIAGR